MTENLSLADLDVLVLDFQATGANPEKEFLMETGWTRTRAAAPFLLDTEDENILSKHVQSYFIQPPEDRKIPRRVSRVTGLKTEDLAEGLTRKKLWKKLSTTAAKIAKAGKHPLCPTIIHYAQFEGPHLRALHQEFAPNTPFPFQIICTYQVTRRLLPTLPHKGLRAVAGYLGFSVPELRRAAHHAAAGAFIWHQTIPLLAEKGIHTLEDLVPWLEKRVSKVTSNGGDYPMDPELRRKLPHQPGVYRMRRSNGDLLYVGKATSLKSRVNSYFHKGKRKKHAVQTLEMLSQAAQLEVTITGSALEASLLETDEIKKHSPPYNIALRQRDRETVFVTRDLTQASHTPDENHTLGPFPSPESILPAGVILELLSQRRPDWDDPEIAVNAFGSLPEYAPPPDCFRDGFLLFREEQKDLLAPMLLSGAFTREPLQSLMNLGRVYHLRRLEEEAIARALAEEAKKEAEEKGDRQEEGEETAEEQEEERGEWEWTPEAVARGLQSQLRRCAHMVRRARWLLLLSESSLAWNTGETAGGERRMLIFRGGNIVHHDNIEEDHPLPPPPGFQRPMAVRLDHFDIKTYDRLRVLTTEIRRLASATPGRNPELRFNNRVTLKQEALLKGLLWI